MRVCALACGQPSVAQPLLSGAANRRHRRLEAKGKNDTNETNPGINANVSNIRKQHRSSKYILTTHLHDTHDDDGQ